MFDFFYEQVFFVFYDLKNVKIAGKSLKIGQFLTLLATFYEFKNHVLKKVGRRSSGNLFSI
jgi:hypothetical protein